MKFMLIAAAMLLVSGVVAAAPPPALTGPVVDPAGLLSPQARAEIRASADEFRKATGRWLVLVALRDSTGVDLSALRKTGNAPWQPEGARTPIGIVYVMTPKGAAGTLLLVDPAWRRFENQQWLPMFPQRLKEKFGEEPFERRAVDSAAYLAEVFPDKIAFLTRPPDVIPEESVEFAENVMTVIKYFVYFIILFTFVRTFWPARLKDEDTDDFSNELRRLKNERRIW